MPPKRKGRKAAPKGKKATPKGKKVVEREKTGFYKLPAEIRNEVYQLALIRNYSIMLPDRKEILEDSDEVPPAAIHEPTLLATTRQVRSEASPIFYGCNKFSVQYALYGPKLVKQLGPERTAMLTSIEVCGVEQVRWVTADRFMHAAIHHANRLFQAADGALGANAALIPVGHGATGGYQRVKDHKEFRFMVTKELPTVEWVGERTLNPVSSVYDVWLYD